MKGVGLGVDSRTITEYWWNINS